LPELKELLDDEEGEVASEAIVQFQKLTTKVLSEDYRKSQDALNLFMKLCDHAADTAINQLELILVLKLMTKFLMAFNQPECQQILIRLKTLLENGKQATFDDDVRAMLPKSFQGIS
jgi:hypothetical protein